MPTQKDIGIKIKHLRLDARMSQKAAAEKLECSASLLNHIENGKKSMTLEMAFRFEMICQDTLRQVSSAIIQGAYERAGGKGSPTPSTINHAFDLGLKPVVAAPKNVPGLTLSIKAEDLRGSFLRIE